MLVYIKVHYNKEETKFFYFFKVSDSIDAAHELLEPFQEIFSTKDNERNRVSYLYKNSKSFHKFLKLLF